MLAVRIYLKGINLTLARLSLPGFHAVQIVLTLALGILMAHLLYRYSERPSSNEKSASK